MSDFGNQLSELKAEAQEVKASKRKHRPIWQLVVTDILLVGISLCVFSLFHHVIPQAGDTEGVSINKPNSTKTDEIGYFGDKFPDKFTTDGSVEVTDNSYKSGSVNISITSHRVDGIAYYIADVYIKSIDCFRTALADDTYGKGYTDTVPHMAKLNDAILATNGDYYGKSSKRGTVIRDGVYYRGNTYRHTCILYRDGTMVTYTEEEYDIDEVLENSPWQGWSFGPMLLDDNGESIDYFDTSLSVENPRTAIGYYEPGHYCFITVDGRQEGYSEGITLVDLADLVEDLGCKVAYNLDGGQSSEMNFNGDTVNRPYKGGRESSDIVYITDLK